MRKRIISTVPKEAYDDSIGIISKIVFRVIALFFFILAAVSLYHGIFNPLATSNGELSADFLREIYIELTFVPAGIGLLFWKSSTGRI